MSIRPVIALLTDFGTADVYVGTMKGVMLGICPDAHLVDLTHDIGPQNIRHAALALLAAHDYFPSHVVFLVVVDPGVGTTRQAIAVETARGQFVAPNNGVLSYTLRQLQVRRRVVLAKPAYQLPAVSNTFHGRDIFSPAAAHLACGVDLDALGPPVSELVALDPPHLDVAPHQVRGEVLYVDRFGNAVTSIGRLEWVNGSALHLIPRFSTQGKPSPILLRPEACCITVNDHRVDGVRATYAAAAPGAPVVLVGSSGQLEIAVNQGSAAKQLGLQPGDPVTLTLKA